MIPVHKSCLLLLMCAFATVLCTEYCNDITDDGEPIFTLPAIPGVTTVPLREDSPPGTVVYTLLASDTEYYLLNAPPPEFGLNWDKIVVTGHLDYETTREYVLNVSAYECIYSRSVVTQLTIQLEPVNEFTPIFTPAVIATSISENSNSGTLVGTLVCDDADIGPNPGCTAYSIQSGDDSTPKFEIVGTSIRTTSSLIDYELLSGQNFVYSLVVVGTDQPQLGSPKTGSASVIVRIIPLNDNAPKFTSATYTGQVAENALPGTFVVSVSAVDEDLGPSGHGDLTYSITGGNADGKFYINPHSGEIFTRRPLDFEVTSSYQLTVRATDGGGLHDDASVSINVQPTNDNPPDCSATSRVVEVDETDPVGTTVMTMTCSDPDVGTSLTYKLNVNGGAFSINTRGDITLTTGLDYELGLRSYSLTVDVSDSIHDIRIRIKIVVKPVNEFPPVFGPSETIYVPENQNTGTVLYNVTATDADVISSELQPVTYTIDSVNNNGNRLFEIDRYSGDIVLVNPLDYESQQSYVITYAAKDHGNLKATSSVTVLISDVNDNAPLCSPDAVTLQLPEDTGTGVTLYTANCQDADNDPLQYSITEQQPNDAMFDVDSTGKLSLSKPFDYENEVFYKVKVGVTDSVSTATVTIAVYVTDVNEGPPEFTSSGIYNATLFETAKKGTSVLTVAASDVDQSRVYFSFSGGHDEFLIDPQGGEIYLKGSLDREVTPLYILYVVASDGTMASTASVYINVNDVNEAPRFLQTAYSFTNEEGSPDSTLVGLFSASDPDKEGDFGKITYAIESGNRHSHFVIEPDTGRMTIAVPTDFEEDVTFELTVSASDSGVPPLSDVCTVTITVHDVNDNPPVFNPSKLTASVSESAPKGISVIRVSASDADSDLNNNNRFFYAAPAATPFKVHASTGIVTVDAPLDRERQDRYSMTILAIDSGDPSLTGTMTLEIKVQDINDNTPQITGTYEATIAEDSTVQTIVFQISAEDKDQGEFSRLYYSILSGNYDSAFKIEPQSGYVQVSSDLDRETRPLYHLVVKVADFGLPQLYTTATVTVSISDVNDNPPIFTQGSRKFVVDENVPFYTRIGALEAVDEDDGINALLFYKVSEFIVGTPGSFLINQTSGEVFTNMALDREKESFYQLRISVTDSGFPSLSSEEVIDITVRDLNDNYPVFQAYSYTKTVPEDIPVGTTILTTAAVDVDLGFYSELTYELDMSSAESVLSDFYFTVHPFFGDLILKRPLDFETYKVLTMTIKAKDGDSPPKTANTNVTIYVTDVNDNQPEFSPVFYNAEAPLTEVCDFIITMVTATDKDQANNAEVFYLIDPSFEQTPFHLELETGVIRARTDLNNSQYVIKVNAQDNGQPRLTSQSATVRIDAFRTEVHVISFTMTLTKTQYQSVESDFLSEVTSGLRSMFPTAYVRRSCVYEGDGNIVVHLYAVENDLSEWIYNLPLPKPFLTADEVVPLFDQFGINKDLWSRFSVEDVRGFYLPESHVSEPDMTPAADTQTDTVNPLAVALPILFILLLLLIALILILLAWKRKWCRKTPEKSPNSSKLPSAPNSPRLVSPSGVKVKPESVGTRNVTSPFIDVPPSDSVNTEENQRPENDPRADTSNHFDKRGVDQVTGWTYVENSATKERRWIRTPEDDPLYNTHM